MKTDLEKYQEELREKGITWVRGGDDVDIQIITGEKVAHFNADGALFYGVYTKSGEPLLLAAAEYFFEPGEECVYMPEDVMTHAQEIEKDNDGDEFELTFAVTGKATFKIVNGHPVMQEMSPFYYVKGTQEVVE